MRKMPGKSQVEPAIAPAAMEGAMRLFWQRGYYDTPIDALITEAGLNRAMIYRRFKTKRIFFCALLEHYRDTVSAQMTAPLRVPDADLAAVRVFFRRLRALAQSEHSRMGCLMVMTGSEVSTRDRSIARIVSEFLDSVRALFVAALERARAAGQLPERVEPVKLADYLFGALIGVLSLARSPLPRAAVANYVDEVLVQLDALTPTGR